MKKVDLARSISAKLSSLSKEKAIPYQNLLTTFLLERLLARIIADRKLAQSLVFKGGYVGLRVYESSRYTIDLDALLLKADVDSTLKRSAEAIESDIGDGTWFILDSQIDLKTQGEYGGIRQTFRTGIGEKPKSVLRAQIINFDIGIGDPVTPGPVKTKTELLLGEGELTWLVYPIETIVAEKLQTLVDRGGNSSRAKDIYDLQYYLPKANTKLLKDAIKKCFKFRGTPIPDDLPNFLSNMDLSLLKRGWKSATASLKDAPDFQNAFQKIGDELTKIRLTG